jgi:hypothetical protein
LSFVVQNNFNGEGATFKASMFDYHKKFKYPAFMHKSWYFFKENNVERKRNLMVSNFEDSSGILK